MRCLNCNKKCVPIDCQWCKMSCCSSCIQLEVHECTKKHVKCASQLEHLQKTLPQVIAKKHTVTY